MRAAAVVLILCATAHASNRVVVMTERDEMPAALQVALASEHVEVRAQPEEPAGALRLDRAASAQRVAVAADADASVWVDGGEIWVVSADGRYVRHAPVPSDATPRVFAAIAASLLDELLVPPEAPTVGVDVHVAVTPAAATAAPQAIVVAPQPVVAPPAYAVAPPPSISAAASIDPDARINASRTIFELGVSLSNATVGVDGEVAFPITQKVRLGVLAGIDYLYEGFADVAQSELLAHFGGELRYVGAGRTHVDLGIGGGVARDTSYPENGGFGMLRLSLTHELQRTSISASLSPMLLFGFDGQYQEQLTIMGSLRIGIPL